MEPINPPAPEATPPRHQSPKKKLIIALSITAVTLIAIVGAAAGGSSNDKTASKDVSTAARSAGQVVGGSEPTPAPTTPAPTTPAPAPTTPAPAPKPAPAPTPPPPPAETPGQSNARRSAQSYLSMGNGFSRQGLIDQLSSQYGEGYSVEDATYGVDATNTDWNTQACLSAKSYLSTQPFSHSGLVEQLSSAYGAQFTPDQAEFGVTCAGI